ncbi:MAG: WYL domain-containing protein [Polyangiales bacterium]
MIGVPSRSSTESIVGIYQAFLKQREWRQADLARALGLSTEGLRKRLIELQQEGVPLASRAEHPHVVWAVPKTWIPGGLALDAGDTLTLVRVLRRAPRGRERDEWIRRVVAAVAPRGLVLGAEVTGAPADEPAKLRVVEEAVLTRAPLKMLYRGSAKAEPAWRTVSPQRFDPDCATRFAAVCHRDGALKWFRVERAYDAVLDRASWWREAPGDALAAMLEESLHGFREEAARDHVFVVRPPDAEWARHNLPKQARVEAVGEGIRVTVRTGAPSVLARFVVGLGASATAESDDLAARVRALAEGALRSSRSG